MAATTESTGKLITAVVLGIVGGVFGIIGALLVILLGGVGALFAAEGSGSLAGFGLASVFIGVLGIIGGALAKAKPLVAAVVMLLAGVLGFIAISWGWVVAGPLLIIGAILAWLGRSRGAAPQTSAQ